MDKEKVHQESSKSNFYIADASILIIYVIWSYVFERWTSVRWLHQTGLAMLAGMVAGLLFQITEHTSESLSTDVILYALLPCIMLDAGYNLNLQEIYQYAGYVLSLGILGSVAMFVMLYTCFQHIPFTGIKGPYPVTSRHRLVMAMVLTASDTVAPLALLPRARHARLHAVVFGEAIMNDVVTLFLSTSVQKLGNPKLLDLAAKSCLDIVLSTVMGVLCGVAVSWGLGFFRNAIRDGPVERPASLILLSCYVTYGSAEKLGLSGVMVMLITAMVLKFATREMLSPQVDEFLTGISRTAGFLAESFMYGYFGMTFVKLVSSNTLEPPSVHFIAYSSISIMVCRIPIVVCVRGFAEVLARDACRDLLRHLRGLVLSGERELDPGSARPASSRLPIRDTVLVGFCGSIRGVLAVVLIIRVLPPTEKMTLEDTFCLQAVLTLVVMHVLVAGPLLVALKQLLRIYPDKESPRERGRRSSLQLAATELAHGAVRLVKRRSREPTVSQDSQGAPAASGAGADQASASAPGAPVSAERLPRRSSDAVGATIEVEMVEITSPRALRSPLCETGPVEDPGG